MGKKVFLFLLLCFCFGIFLGESRPFEPEYDSQEMVMASEGSGSNVEAEAEPALIMLRHMWQSVQELKRKQNSEDVPSFGQGLAQQLDVLRKLNRRQALKRQIEAALENAEAAIEGEEEAAKENGVAGHAQADPHFPSETKKPLLLILGRTPEPQN